MPRSAVPNVQIGVNIDGTISITAPQGCKLSVPALMDASEVSEDKIKSVIADFVDMLVPESKWGLRDDIARERGTDERRKPVSLVSGAI